MIFVWQRKGLVQFMRKTSKKVYKIFEKEKAGPVSEENTARYEEIKSKWNIEEPHYMIIDNMAIDGKSSQFKKSKFAILNHELPSLFYLEYTNSAQGRVLHTNGTLPQLKVRKLDPIIEESSWQLYPFLALPEEGNWYQVHWNIDLSKSDDDLRNIFNEKIRNLKKMVKEDKTRQRGMLCDPWEVYDLHKSGHTLLKIARRQLGIECRRGEKTPAYNNRLDAAYQSVRRALDRAKKMIKAIEEEAHYRIKKDARFDKDWLFKSVFFKELSKMYE